MTWAGPRCVQEAATFLGPQNRTQGRCVTEFSLQMEGTFKASRLIHIHVKLRLAIKYIPNVCGVVLEHAMARSLQGNNKYNH